MRAFILLFIWFIPNASTITIKEELTQDIQWYYYSEIQYHRSKYFNYCDLDFLRMFDFTSLTQYTKNDAWIDLDENSILRFHFCTPLVKPCNGKEGYSICLHKNGTEIGIGRQPPRSELSNDTVIFSFTGDTYCNATHNYTANFKMKCNQTMEGWVSVDFNVTNWTDICHFDLPMETSTTCRKKGYAGCFIGDSRDRYDSLRDFSKNYKVQINHNFAIILNVCYTLIYGRHHIGCGYDALVCLINQTNPWTAKYESIVMFKGNPFNHETYRNNLWISSDNHSLCYAEQFDEWRTIKSTIEFVCDLNAIEPVLEYIGGWKFCQYNFIWRTIAACSEKVLHDQSLVNRDFCTVKDPLTQYEYDLSSFKNKVFKARTIEGTYAISVCSFMDDTVCKTGTGVCKFNNESIETNEYYDDLGESGGIANGKLMWKESGPYLNYTDGDVCYKGTKKYTIISFLCSETDSVEVEDKICHTNINFHTSTVCKRPCAMSLYDMNFERLIQSKSNYIIKFYDGMARSLVYYINVCRPLVNKDQFSFNCSSGAGICKAEIDNENGKLTNEVNLGYPDQNLRGESDGSVVLTYTNGSLCEEDDEQRISSRIKFVCDLDHDEGTPRLVYYHNCTYHFEWKTKRRCGTVQSQLNDDKCQVTNVYGDTWDLSGLNELDFYMFSGVKDNENYTLIHLSLCQGKKVCNDSYICDDKMSYGRNVAVTSDYQTNTIIFHFTNGSQCADGSNAQSTLYVKCNESAIVGELIVLSDQYCNPELELSIAAICLHQRPSFLDSTTSNPITDEDSTFGGAIMIFILIMIFVTVVFLYNASKIVTLIKKFLRKLF